MELRDFLRVTKNCRFNKFISDLMVIFIPSRAYISFEYL